VVQFKTDRIKRYNGNKLQLSSNLTLNDLVKASNKPQNVTFAFYTVLKLHHLGIKG